MTRLGQCLNGRIGWRWLVWHRFSHKYRTQRRSRLQLHDSKRRVRGSGIFDSHRPLQNLRNDSPLPGAKAATNTSPATLESTPASVIPRPVGVADE